MENKSILTCEEVMDELDRSPLDELNEPFRTHLSGCRACANYRILGRKLAGYIDHEADGNRWNGFIAYQKRMSGKERFFRITRVMAGAIAAAVIAVVLTVSLTLKNSGMTTADKGNMIASNGTYMTPASDYDPETTDLNYYHEISFQN